MHLCVCLCVRACGVCFTSTRSSSADIVDVQEEGFGQLRKHDADFNLLCDADCTSCKLVVSGRSFTPYTSSTIQSAEAGATLETQNSFLNEVSAAERDST
jgi:hypothetical protein